MDSPTLTQFTQYQENIIIKGIASQILAIQTINFAQASTLFNAFGVYFSTDTLQVMTMVRKLEQKGLTLRHGSWIVYKHNGDTTQLFRLEGKNVIWANKEKFFELVAKHLY